MVAGGAEVIVTRWLHLGKSNAEVQAPDEDRVH